LKVFVKAKPGAKVDKVVAPQPRLIPEDEEWYVVSVKERAVEGRATEAVMRLLAEHFKVSRSAVRLVSGATSKRKVFEIKS
jgi:uncharacterized protein